MTFFISVQASMHALHACAHIRHTSLCSACAMQASMHIRHIATHASSIAIIAVGSMPCIRIIARIMVLHMSAQFIQAALQSIICAEHTVHACSHAEQASMHACMTDMSIACIPGMLAMPCSDIAPIIIESISHLAFAAPLIGAFRLEAGRGARLRTG